MPQTAWFRRLWGYFYLPVIIGHWSTITMTIILPTTPVSDVNLGPARYVVAVDNLGRDFAAILAAVPLTGRLFLATSILVRCPP